MTSLHEIGRDAFVYGLPTVDLYRILHRFALDPNSPDYLGPLNALHHGRVLATPDDRTVVAPNVDTLYSYAWLDLRGGPVALAMPPLDGSRYVSAQVIDLYTYIVGYVSPRTGAALGGEVLIVGPGHDADESAGPVMRCPTQLCLVQVRTEVIGSEDLFAAHAVQDQMAVRAIARAEMPPLVPAPDPVEVRHPPTITFLTILNWMLYLMPVLPEEERLRAELSAIGIGGVGLRAVLEESAADLELLQGMHAGLAEVQERMQSVRSSAELFGSREFLADDYLTRAAGAYLGILGNAADEYLGVGYRGDREGNPFDGASRYRITFNSDELPQVAAFWSITAYDQDQFLYANGLDRHALGSRQVDGMVRGADGSLTLLVQHEPPDDDHMANWLPCPDGPFLLTFRTYLPGKAIRDGSWTAPAVEKVSE